MSTPLHNESFPPPSHNPPGTTLLSRLRYFARICADLQVVTGVRSLKPWLANCSGKILEVGCGAQPYRHLVPAACDYTGLDWEGSKEQFDYHVPDTVYYDGGVFPFGDASFARLFHTQVLEHIYEDRFFMQECRRVLNPGGELFFTVPFQARYHYIPHDFRRYTPAALERMLREAGFAKIMITPLGSDLTVAAYKCLSLVYRWLQGGVAGKILGVLTLPAGLLFLLAGQLSLLLPVGSADDCLGYAVLARAE
jgi:SAM-dependent methyltransferase